MTSALRDTILSATDKERKAIEVPEWGVTVHIRAMTVGELQAFEKNAKDFQKAGTLPPNFREQLAVQYLEDEAGTQIFDKRDVPALTAKSAKPMQRILEAFMEINGLSEKDLEDLEGN